MSYIELTQFPQAILEAEDGDVFLINDKQFVVEHLNDCVVLSVIERDHDQDGTQYLWSHLRNSAYRSLLTKDEVFTLLKTNSYIIY